ncbi:hypothetical protein MMC13_002959 [Lambiella insularis]|nr:hypothetical protein [Lambiella insularis]
MRLSIAFLASTLAAIVSCQIPNAFNLPASGDYLLTAGEPITLTWGDLSGSTVTLTLRDGPNGALNPGTVIQSGIANTGTYTYNVPLDITPGNTYTIMITNDQDPSQVNYSPQFDLVANPTMTVPVSTASSTMTSMTSASTSMSSSTPSSSMTTMTTTATATTTTTTTTGRSSSTSSSSSSTQSSTTSASATQTTNAAVALHAGVGLGAVMLGAVAFL